jgi:AcrR family transcriptional regulator
MLDAALALLDEGGSGALTMRALGESLGVNPMTVHHHFGSRDGLVAALADRVYADVAPPPCADARARLEGLLRAYRAKVQQHPALTLEVFQSQTAFPAQARSLSELLVALLCELGLARPRALLWRDLLVDYVHGAALAEAMGGLHDAPLSAAPEPSDRRLDPLTELIATVLLAEVRGP